MKSFDIDYFYRYISSILDEVKKSEIYFDISTTESFEESFSRANHDLIKVYNYLYELHLIRLEFREVFSSLSFDIKRSSTYERFNSYLSEAISLIKFRYDVIKTLIDSLKSYTFYFNHQRFR